MNVYRRSISIVSQAHLCTHQADFSGNFPVALAFANYLCHRTSCVFRKFCLFSFKGSGFCQVVWFVWGWIPTGLIKLIKHRQRYSVWKHQLNALKLVVQLRTIGIWIPFKDSCPFVTFVAVVLLLKVTICITLKTHTQKLTKWGKNDTYIVFGIKANPWCHSQYYQDIFQDW